MTDKEKKNHIENKYENTCFVIMPISDQQGYPEGHFTHIYENY